MLTEVEQTKSRGRSNAIDYARISDLHYLGNYVRRLPTNMARMMENAYDWEHLPFIHSSSFSSIDLVESGPWGWRAKIGVPGGPDPTFQMLDLLVDVEKNYWVSAVFGGPGEGIEIHTQATTLNELEIEVDIRFYLPVTPEKASVSANILKHMQQQYEVLYDEDVDLMQGRQSALEDRSRWRVGASSEDILVGSLASMDETKTLTLETSSGRYCVRMWQNRWIAHNAVCPHLLGPLDDSAIDSEGHLTCPWHGYSFDIATGENLEKQCSGLARAPDLVERDGKLYLRELATI